MDSNNTTPTMTPLNVGDASAPLDIKDSKNQENGEAKLTPATNPVDVTSFTREKVDVAAGYPKNLTLDIGGRKFKVSRDTLKAESGLFERQLSNRFSTWEPEADGSYFMDADPDLFEHLLRFMRRPEVFPLFYSMTNGFDYDLYNRLEAEALYFQMDTLYTWIKDKVCCMHQTQMRDTDVY
jgi:hypothetical protein